MRELQHTRQKWGACALLAFALLVAALALWVLAPDNVWMRTRSAESGTRRTRSDALVSTPSGASSEHDGRPSSSPQPPKAHPVRFAVVTLNADTRELKRSHSKTISGHVRFDDGVPVAGASVVCDLVGAQPGTRSPFDEHTTNATGYFALLVSPGEIYTVQARCGKGWASDEQRAEAGKRDVAFVVPRARRLEVALLDAEVDRSHPVRTVNVRWPQNGEQTELKSPPDTAVVVLPGAPEVDEGQDVVVEVFGAGRSGRTFRLARNELDRGPLLRTLRYEPPLKGTWILRAKVVHHDGTPFDGWGAVRYKPYRRARHGMFRGGVQVFTGLDRNFDEVYLDLQGGARRRLEFDRPVGEVEHSLTLPRPWTLILAPRFESARRPDVYVLPHVSHAADPEHRASWAHRNLTKEGPPWTGTGMGDGHWWVRIMAIQDKKERRTLWEQKVTLAGGDEVTLSPLIQDKRPGKED